MPLWLQGGLETAQAAIISALLVVVPIVAVWATAGFRNTAFDALARLAGQAWLLIHGVPLQLAVVSGEAGAAGSPGSGLLTLVPLGLTLIPFLLAWRAGRRLARPPIRTSCGRRCSGPGWSTRRSALPPALCAARPTSSLTSGGQCSSRSCRSPSAW
ncbi:conserved hypothetical protein [Arthrobacter sp. Hiyo4]|nr:conserved hypothetical protein [Arthrobacter sp. Hiyo4]